MRGERSHRRSESNIETIHLILFLNAPLHYAFCFDLNMYDHKVNVQAYLIF